MFRAVVIHRGDLISELRAFPARDIYHIRGMFIITTDSHFETARFENLSHDIAGSESQSELRLVEPEARGEEFGKTGEPVLVAQARVAVANDDQSSGFDL